MKIKDLLKPMSSTLSVDGYGMDQTQNCTDKTDQLEIECRANSSSTVFLEMDTCC